MRIKEISSKKIGILDIEEVFEKNKTIMKSKKYTKLVYPPCDILQLLNIVDENEYHFGCIDAIKQNTLSGLNFDNELLKNWFNNANDINGNVVDLIGEMVGYYQACGNAFLVKLRNSLGQWVGIERLLPNEVLIVEKYNEFGFPKPDYIQFKNGKENYFDNRDIIHFKRNTHRSNFWGVSSLPVLLNTQILKEIKIFDYNNFKNGLLIDYFLVVEGGMLRNNVIIDHEGNEIETDAFAVIEENLRIAKGNNSSHSTILIELENKDAKLRLEPLRQETKDGGFLNLKKDLREGIFAYHRVPPRLVSQLVSGQLGGDNNSDLTLFYLLVVKPLQERINWLFTREFNKEYNWNLDNNITFTNLLENLI